MRSAASGIVAALLTACAAGPSAQTSTTPTSAQTPGLDDAARAALVRAAETQVIELLAASDPRFAARVGGAKEARLHTASVKALAAGDPDAAIEDGALDFFSFTARGRSITEAEGIVATLPTTVGEGPEALERALLLRLVAEERARLDEERALPRGASALVRGLVDTWAAPESRPAADVRDARVARRLEELRTSLANGALSRIELAELDDALDPLERIATPDLFGKTVQALARLRLTLGDTATHPRADDGSWPRLHAALQAHLGIAWDASELRARLVAAEHTLRLRANAPGSSGAADAHALADAWTLRSAGCAPSVQGSPLRALTPPPERAPVCGALHATLDAAGSAPLIALHDDTVLALWSLAVHEAHLTPAQAADTAHLFFGTQPDREAHLLRYAAARPVATIAAGLSAAELASKPEAELAPFATRWLAFGDAPIDLALGALAPPQATSTLPAPASPRP